MPSHSTAWLVVLLLFQAVQFGLILWLLRTLSTQRVVAPSKPTAESLGALAAQVEPVFRRQSQALNDAQTRAADLLERSERILQQVARIQAKVSQSAPDPVDQHETAVLLARADARRLLAAGHTTAEVAAATGLPQGEISVLANLLQAREPQD